MRCNGHEGRHRNGLAFLAVVFLWSISSILCAQNRNVTLKYTATPIKEVFKSIKDQTGLSVIYHTEDINPEKTVTVTVTDQPVADAMQLILQKAGSSLSYVIQDNYIVLTKGTPSPSTQRPVSGKPQKRSVSGTVTDQSGEPLIGVTVIVEGNATIGNVTDLDGNYTLNNVPSDASLQFSYVGMKTEVVPVSGQTVINVTMASDTELLEEVVVTALGIKRSEKALSYNVQQVKAEELTTVKDANFMNALAGKVARVNINASSVGIGGATRVVMRGPKSINQSNQALYVIDGVPIFNMNKGEINQPGRYGQVSGGEGISDINPDDIESMSVLSGPAAAALYGSNAAQGVIMITTKKGKEGAVKVSITNNSSFISPFIMPQFQTRYMNAPNEVGSWETTQGTSPFGTYDPKGFFNTGTNIQNTVSITAGTPKNQTYFSIGTTNSAGIIPNSKYNRYNFTIRNTTSFSEEKATLDFGFNYIIQDDRNLIGQGEYMNPLLPLYLFPRGENFDAVRVYRIWNPGRGIYEQNWTGSTDMHMQNPYWIAHEIRKESKKQRYMANASLKYQLADWLDFIGRVRIDNATVDFEDKRPATTDELFTYSKYGYYGYSKSDERAFYGDLMMNVNKLLDNFSITGSLGVSMAHEYYDSRGQKGGLKAPANIFMPFAIDYGFATKENAPTFSRWQHRTNSAFASAEVGYKSRYYLTLTGRNDWDSSLSGTKYPSFFYPSVGFSTVLSEVIKMPDFISYLKARGSWASVGSAIPRNLSSSFKYSYDPATQGYVSESYLMPDEFYPERTYSWEAGLTAKFLHGLINFDATLYKSNTTKQTFLRSISPSGGYSSKYIQMGDVENRGVELSLGLDKRFGAFEWGSYLTYSANINKIVKLIEDNPTEEIHKGGFNQIEVILREGGTMGDLYVYNDLERDHEGNLLINEKDMVVKKTLSEPRFVGSVLPKGNVGWRNDFRYKGFNFGFMFAARLGGINVSTTQALLDQYGVSERSAKDRDHGGIDVNLGKIDTQGYYQVVGGENAVWSEYIYSATNVRLQEAYIGYNCPVQLLGNRVVLGLSLTGRNLLMLYNKSPFDPELTASTGTYYQGFDYFMQPSLRNLGFSVKVSF